MRPLTLLLGCLLISTPLLAQLPAYVPTDGLVAWYPLNGGCSDLGPNLHDGTANNIGYSSDRFGQSDQSAHLNGSNAFIGLNFPSVSNTLNALTINAWVKTTDAHGPVCALRAANGGHTLEFNIGTQADIIQNPGHIGSLVRNSCCGAGNNFFGSQVNDNQWHMVTLIRQSNGVLRIYDNAVLTNQTGASNGGALQFANQYMALGSEQLWDNSPSSCGSCNSPHQRYLEGQLDDVGFWSRELSAAELSALYSAPASSTSGCMDSAACNYDSEANLDDGSCKYPGCTDSEACNYDETAGCDDGSCVFPPLVELGSNTTLCEGESLELSVDAPGLTTTWSTGATGSNLIVTETGTYSVQSGGEFGADYRLEFDGVDDYVSFGPSLDITTYPFSIQADIKVPSDYWAIMETDDGTDGYSGIWFEISSNTISLSVGEGSGASAGNRRSKSANHSLTSGDIINIAGIVRGATDMSIYVDGIDMGGTYSGSGNTTFIDNGFDAVIGRHTPSSGPSVNQIQYNDGSIDNLHVWTKALTTEEVVQYAEASATGAEDGLLAVYTFDEEAGNTASDDAQGFEASLFGDPSWVLEEAGCSASDTITVNFIDCESLCGPGTTWDPILQSCVADTPDATAAEDCSLFTLQELSSGYLLQQGQLDLQDTLIIGLQQQVDSLNALLNNCPGND